MGNFGRFGGGQPNMQALMRQAQKMQEEALQAQKEVEESEVEGVASNGLVKVKMNGNKEVLSLNIDPSIVDPEDVEMLEDLIVVAINDASAKIEKIRNEKMGKFGGLM